MEQRRFTSSDLIGAPTAFAADRGLVCITAGSVLRVEIAELHIAAAKGYGTTNQQIDITLQTMTATGTGTAGAENKVDDGQPEAATATVVFDAASSGNWDADSEKAAFSFASLAGLHHRWDAGEGPTIAKSDFIGVRNLTLLTSTKLMVTIVWREI